MPTNHKKVNRSRKVIRRGKKMSTGGSRKMNRTRKTVSRSKKMSGGMRVSKKSPSRFRFSGFIPKRLFRKNPSSTPVPASKKKMSRKQLIEQLKRDEQESKYWDNWSKSVQASRAAQEREKNLTKYMKSIGA